MHDRIPRVGWRLARETVLAGQSRNFELAGQSRKQSRNLQLAGTYKYIYEVGKLLPNTAHAVSAVFPRLRTTVCATVSKAAKYK